MADKIFENKRLADVYDLFDSAERPDLDPYIAMVEEFNAQKIIDLGCGTGNLACKLAASEKEVIGVDPAAASLDIAKRKRFADKVQWYNGTIEMLPDLQADLITMTGNVAQVFVTDDEWNSTLKECRSHIKPGGKLIFEVRDPAKEAWKNWVRSKTHCVIEAPEIGKVERWHDLLDVQLPFVTFRHTFVFHNDGKILTSESTLRFRSKTEVINSLDKANLIVEDIRDAPDRPGLEFVFIARRPD
ncbi:methyltransferase domain-containing protein [Ornithinibacillus sp. L9]|uniref:Methyltransferase domain-containing protein n=1 Tax=Ornithinibacillus caprae TaxID=2678566 RepID=A0A6N8FEC7_9BACI|nr:class I SAM-dependent methyltransferase [Ornithinibacillus caprae]MUK87873.1 methyltransferase domain-containing protein [Ornithinibacillus caprae]